MLLAIVGEGSLITRFDNYTVDTELLATPSHVHCSLGVNHGLKRKITSTVLLFPGCVKPLTSTRPRRMNAINNNNTEKGDQKKEKASETHKKFR